MFVSDVRVSLCSCLYVSVRVCLIRACVGLQVGVCLLPWCPVSIQGGKKECIGNGLVSLALSTGYLAMHAADINNKQQN